MARTYPSTGSQPPSVELTVRHGPQPGQRFALTQPTITIGREAGNDVAINDPQVSRRHASLTWDGRQFIIQDLGSANGTFVNGVRLTAPQVLQPGDVIGLGPTVLLGFQALPVAAAPPPAYAPPPPVVSPVEPPAYAPRPPARRRGRLLIPLTALLGLCFVLAVAAALGTFFLWPRGATRPLVLIRSPHHGEQVEVGQEVTVHSVARDEGKVTRVELWVDGQLQESQTSNLPGGTSPFPLLARWQPSSPGTHTLIARAFNARGGRGQASVNVEAIEEADRDNDGVADDADGCPDEPGSATADGCPDTEGDGIPDAEDACPLVYGLPAGDGCPMPGEGDRDGDGTLDDGDACVDEPGSPFAEGCPDVDDDGVDDSEDACPTEPGWPHPDGCPRPGDSDGDSVPDAEDACPDGWGLPEHEGCPDDDGDGIPDPEDADPDEPGPGSTSGAPDRDSDGVSDAEDICPDVPGLPWNAGCPDTGAGDSDDDGIADDVDLAPDEAGLSEHGGAPPPGEGEDADDDGFPDAEEPPENSLFSPLSPWLDELFVPTEEAIVPVEVEVLEFSVLRVYTEIECYARVNDYDVELVTFRTAGENRWDIEFLGGENSRTFLVDDTYPLELWMECRGYQPMLGPEGNYELGAFTTQHPLEEWDGRVLFMNAPGHVDSTPGDSGHGFRIQYRICAGSCEESPLPPPVLTWYEIGPAPMQYLMRWSWDGDEEAIDGFLVFQACEHSSGFIHRFPKDRHLLSSLDDPGFFRVSCDDRCEYYVRAYREEGPGMIWSARSNVGGIEAETCPTYALVYFETLPIRDLPPDEGHTGSVGPIYGELWAEGGGERGSLVFDFHSCRRMVEGRCTGVYFVDDPGAPAGGNRIWDDFFCAVHRRQAEAPHCPILQSFTVPDTNVAVVALMPGDDLTIGGRIMDYDSDDGDDALFDAQLTLEPGEITEGEHMISDGISRLGIRLRLVAVPIVGGPFSCD